MKNYFCSVCLLKFKIIKKGIKDFYTTFDLECPICHSKKSIIIEEEMK